MRGKRDVGFERGLRRQSTDAEHRLWFHLRDRRLKGFKFRRQHRLGPYVVDFVCLDRGVVLELDGGQHLERASYDALRSQYLEGQGFRVLRFWNDEVLTRTEQVLAEVLRALED
jgi:very-short-patch-repair endonuclease